MNNKTSSKAITLMIHAIAHQLRSLPLRNVSHEEVNRLEDQLKCFPPTPSWTLLLPLIVWNPP